MESKWKIWPKAPVSQIFRLRKKNQKCLQMFREKSQIQLRFDTFAMNNMVILI